MPKGGTKTRPQGSTPVSAIYRIEIVWARKLCNQNSIFVLPKPKKGLFCLNPPWILLELNFSINHKMLMRFSNVTT